MSRKPDIRAQLQNLMQQLAAVDLNNIDFKNAGSWPKAGKISAWVLIAAAALTAGYLLMLAPQLDALHKAREQEAFLLRSFEIKAFQGANLPAYRQQMQQIEQQLTRLDKQLPRHKAIPELIELIGEQARRNRVSVRSLKLQPNEQHEAYQAQPLSLEVAGGYHQLAAFIAGLSQAERIISLHDFTLEQGPNQLRLKIEALAYHSSQAVQEAAR